MSFSSDLLDQARELMVADVRRPKQSSLRRAVSTAYYGLFHLLTEEATLQMLGTAAGRRRMRHAVARSFSHASMARACKAFASGQFPKQVEQIVHPLHIPVDLQVVAWTFTTLQNARHRADYNLAAPFQRAEVIALVESAEQAVEAWHRVKMDDASRFFLASLPLWDRMERG